MTCNHVYSYDSDGFGICVFCGKEDPINQQENDNEQR